jgi:hypothetical protein
MEGGVMSAFKVLRGFVVAAGIAVGLAMVLASGALAAGVKICIPEKEGASIVTAKAGVCKAKYKASTLLPQAEQEKLEQVLPYVTYEAEGIDKKPTIQFSGANVQVLSGSGSTHGTLNGEGNLVIGYDEEPGLQTGSNNLVVGFKQSYTSYASIVGGEENSASGPNSDVFGVSNHATKDGASISGGAGNTASGDFSSVSGGYGNLATYEEASVSGGTQNEASAEDASISGGYGNKAEGYYDSVSGGASNTDAAGGDLDSILGAADEKLTGSYEIYPAAP